MSTAIYSGKELFSEVIENLTPSGLQNLLKMAIIDYVQIETTSKVSEASQQYKRRKARHARQALDLGHDP